MVQNVTRKYEYQEMRRGASHLIHTPGSTTAIVVCVCGGGGGASVVVVFDDSFLFI